MEDWLKEPTQSRRHNDNDNHGDHDDYDHDDHNDNDHDIVYVFCHQSSSNIFHILPRYQQILKFWTEYIESRQRIANNNNIPLTSFSLMLVYPTKKAFA